MKKTGTLAVLLLFFSLISFAQPMGRVLEGQIFSSKILGKNARYTIYFPPGYEVSSRKYPVLYLLHGYGDADNGWVQFGEVNRLADAAILSGEVPPMIIVMPDGEKTWYINSFDGKTRYEDFFVQEFMPEIEQKYPIRAEKRFRGIAGLSMGGYGTLIMALKHPELFAACAPLSAAVWTDAEINEMPLERFSGLLTGLYGSTATNRLTEHYYKNSILKIAETAGADKLKSVRYWLDCGDDDFLIAGNCALHLLLKKRGIPHKFMVRHGEHNWPYWRSGLVPALRFIGESFHQF